MLPCCVAKPWVVGRVYGDSVLCAGCCSCCWLLLLLQDLLSDRSRVLQVVLDEARAVAAKHGQPRRSRILVRHTAVDMPHGLLLDCCASFFIRQCGSVPNSRGTLVMPAASCSQQVGRSCFDMLQRSSLHSPE